MEYTPYFVRACAKDAHVVVYSKQIVMNSLFIPKLGENALAGIIV